MQYKYPFLIRLLQYIWLWVVEIFFALVILALIPFEWVTRTGRFKK